jgi:integrase
VWIANACDCGIMTPRKPAASNLRYGEGSITERNGKYQARWLDETGRARAKTFLEEAKAEDHLRMIAREKRAHRYVSPSEITIEELVTQYIDRAVSRLSTSTIATYRHRAKHHIVPALGSIRAVDLTTSKAQHWIDAMIRRKWSTATIIGANVILKSAYDEGLRLDIVASNPLRGIRLPATKKKQHTVWTGDHMRAVLQDVATQPMWHALYRLMLVTGMRPGEARALQWSDVDLDKGRVTIQRTITTDDRGRQMAGSDTKTGRSRTVALPASCVKALRTWRTEQRKLRLQTYGWHESGWVFTGKRGRFLSAITWFQYQDRMTDRLDIPRLTLHQLRHSAATALLEQGVHPKIVSDILGHSRIQITLDTYSHPDESLQRDAIDQLEASIDAQSLRKSGAS